LPAEPLDEIIGVHKAREAKEQCIFSDFDMEVSGSQDIPDLEIRFPWYVRHRDILVRQKLKTSSTALDSLLNGGVARGCITDFYGTRSSGKSQICFQFAFNNSVAEKNTLFIDTLGSFRPERIKQISNQKGVDVKKILDRIFVLRCSTVDQQLSMPQKIREFLNKMQASLVIIDDITNNFVASRTEETNVELRSLFAKHLHEISHLAMKHSLFIVITNSVRSRPEVQGVKITREMFAQIISRAVSERIRLENTENYIVASKEGKIVRFNITKAGVSDQW
jgi:RecA/RadA recombinase